MCTVWAALFLFLSLSVSVPAFPPSSSSSFAFFLYLPLTLASSLSASSLFFLPRVVPPVFPDPPSVPFSVSPPFPLSFSHTHTHTHTFPVSLRLSLSHRCRIPFLSLSLRLSRALDFSPASFTVPRFFLSLVSVYHPSSARPLPPPAPLLPPPSPIPSIFLPPSLPLSTYPRRLRRDGPIFSSRFLGSDIFYTFFLPLQRLPMRRSLPRSLSLPRPRQRNTASSIRSVSLHLASHIRT